MIKKGRAIGKVAEKGEQAKMSKKQLGCIMFVLWLFVAFPLGSFALYQIELKKAEKDILEIRELTEKLLKYCVNGNGDNCDIYQGEKLTPEETIEKIVKLAKDSCENKLFDGCVMLAEYYRVGFGMPMDKNKSSEIYKKLCGDDPSTAEKEAACSFVKGDK